MQINKNPKSNYPIEKGGVLGFCVTKDKKLIRFAIWGKGERGLVIFLNGRNEYIEKYNEAYKKFQTRGFCVVTLDWRGQGLSSREKFNNGHIKNFNDYQLDLEAVLASDQVKRIKGNRFIVAHSTGACIALRTLHLGKHKIKAAIFLAPLWGWGDLLGNKIVRSTIALISKSLTFIGLGKISCGPKNKNPYILKSNLQNNCHTSDPEQFERLQEIIKKDSRLNIGPPSFSWIASADKELKTIPSKRLSEVPNLVVVGSDDNLICKATAKEISDQNQKSKFLEFLDARHEILIEKKETTSRFWKEFDRFISINS
jgi:lysophospholipase